MFNMLSNHPLTARKIVVLIFARWQLDTEDHNLLDCMVSVAVFLQDASCTGCRMPPAVGEASCSQCSWEFNILISTLYDNHYDLETQRMSQESVWISLLILAQNACFAEVLHSLCLIIHTHRDTYVCYKTHESRLTQNPYLSFNF